jgi:hypothetical protein
VAQDAENIGTFSYARCSTGLRDEPKQAGYQTAVGYQPTGLNTGQQIYARHI